MADVLNRVSVEPKSVSRASTPTSSVRSTSRTGAAPRRAATPERKPVATVKAGTPGAKAATPGAKATKAAGATATPAKKNKPASTKPPTTAQLQEYGFKVLGPIAAGAFSTIIRAQHVASKTEVAVKTFAKCDGPQAEEHERELSVLRLISETRHAHIANLVAEYETPIGTCAMLFYCGSGSLHALLGKLRKKQMAMNEEGAAMVTAQVASALAFLHANGVAHRDLKPGNVLHDGQRWRLCDFGFAVVCHDEKLKNSCGTLVYSAPELLFGAGGGELSYVGHSVDMWAFGCLLYEMRIGRTAFVAPDESTIRLRIKNGFKGGSETHPWLPHMKKEKSLITGLLQLSPEKRTSAERVLKHPWIVANCTPTAETAEGKAIKESAVQNWWCDCGSAAEAAGTLASAAPGCLRPTEKPDAGAKQSTVHSDNKYPEEHRAWGDGMCRPDPCL